MKHSKEQFVDRWTWREPGIGYLSGVVPEDLYDEAYINHYRVLEKTERGARINQFRRQLVGRMLRSIHPLAERVHAFSFPALLDVGPGSGSFLQEVSQSQYPKFKVVRGHDVNPYGIEMLKVNGWFCEDIYAEKWDVVTFWDSLEHIPHAQEVVKSLNTEFICVSIPIFRNEEAVFNSKHFKPGEHFHYFTLDGFIAWMKSAGYELLEMNWNEILVGRENIGAFGFRKIS